MNHRLNALLDRIATLQLRTIEITQAGGDAAALAEIDRQVAQTLDEIELVR